MFRRQINSFRTNKWKPSRESKFLAADNAQTFGLYVCNVKLTDKVVWITGASSGIGEALARVLHAEGCKLILSARRMERLQQLADDLGNESVKVLSLDLEQTDKLRNAAEEAMQLFGRIDIVALNGGVSQRSLTAETTTEVDRRIMEINYFANTIIAKAVLPSMRSNGLGHFMVTSSLTGKFGFKLRSAYAASKHALHGFFESLRYEEIQSGIGVTIVCPGLIRTELSKTAVTADGSSHGQMDPMQLNGMPAEECARQMVNALKAEKHEVVIGGKERFSVVLKRFFPRWHFKIMSKRDPN